MTTTTRKRAQWSDESREAARQRAHAMIAEGRFGGRAGQGGRRRKRAPGEDDLLATLREQIRRAKPSPRQKEALTTVAAVARFASRLPLDRRHLASLLVMGMQQLVNDGNLAALVEINGAEL